MAPLLLSLTLFAAFWLIGLALLAAVRADLTSLRVALMAPALGSASTVLPLFVCSSAGVRMQYGGPGVVTALLLGSTLILVKRRPRLPRKTTPIAAACLGGAFLSAWPFFHFGFSWIANANSDMTLYVLSATRLVHHGLLSTPDAAALAGNHDFAGLGGQTYAEGGRPGSDITLAALSGLSGRPAYALFMPLSVALHLVTIFSVAALAMQATRRWWAALVAAILFAVSPLATFGLLQQLLPQVWGLGLAAVLLTLLMRRELYEPGGAGARDVLLIGVTATALVIVYVELASTVVLAYALYLLLLAARRQVALASTVLRLWLPVVAIVLLALNAYVLRDAEFVRLQVAHGTQSADNPPAFGYALVPSALAAVVGLQRWNASPTSLLVGLSIVAAAAILAAVFVGVGATLRRGQAGSIAVAASALLAVLLIVRVSDFGLFKLAMYVQPFLAASIAVQLSMLGRRFLVPIGTLVALVVVAQLYVQFQYVRESLDPIDLRKASASSLIPAFERQFPRSVKPVISVTDNPVLAKLQASVAGSKDLYFVSNNVFGEKWKRRIFNLHDAFGDTTSFQDNARASALLAANQCNLVLPTGSQNVFNRRALPEGSPALVFRDCKAVRNTLVFTDSSHGAGFYTGGETRRDITLYQLEPDYIYPDRTFSAVGRYLLFRLIRPEAGARLQLWMSTTTRPGNETRLPPAVAIGAERLPIPVVGRGSARVFSPPLQPEMIGGQPYVLLDLGRDGTRPTAKRAFIQGLFGPDVALDPRFLTAFARDISVVGGTAYRELATPSSVGHFPRDLANEALEYSGIYEDGWVGKESYTVLAGGPASTLVVRARVQAFRFAGQRLAVSVDGREVVSRTVRPGRIEVRVRVPAAGRSRRIDLQWSRETRLRGSDERLVAARLTSIGLVPPPAAIDGAAGLRHPGLVTTGIDRDGWLRQLSTAVLAGGARGTFVFRALVPPLSGGRVQRVRVLVDGRQVASQRVQPGSIEIRAAAAASERARRVAVVWGGITRLAGNDRRQAAARLAYLGVLPEYAPKRVRIPGDLRDPRLSYTGIHEDGWLEKRAQLLLAGGASGNLTLRIQAPRDNRLDVLVNGKTIASRAVKAGVLELKAPIPPSSGPRQVQLRWASTARIADNDPRQAAALLEVIAVDTPQPPAALRNIPADLAMPNVSSSGIYEDGWLRSEASLLLAGGASGELRIRAEVIARGRQQLDVIVNGKIVAARDVAPGVLDLHIPIGPSLTARNVELRWSTAIRIGPNDPRLAAALLKSIAIETKPAPASLDVADLARPDVAYSGIYEDGWLQKRARVLLKGGLSGELAVSAEVTAGRRLDVVVNDRVVTGLDVPPGRLELRIPVGPSATARTVELRWSTVGRIGASDPRLAAALLRSIGIRSVRPPTTLRADDLASGQHASAGIYKDGWLEQDARVLLAGGPAGTLTIRAQTSIQGQSLRLTVNGRTVATKSVKPGQISVETTIPASSTPRTVELHWDKLAPIAPNDPREAAALLQSIGIKATPGSVPPRARPPQAPPRSEGSIRASLTVGHEDPAPAGATLGKGTFTGTVANGQLRWSLRVSRLSGPVVAAVIRLGKRGQTGDRLLYLCSPCASSASGTVIVTKEQEATLRNAETYVNVGTQTNPFGEIRGQIIRG